MRVSFQKSTPSQLNVTQNKISFKSTNLNSPPDEFLRSSENGEELRELLNQKYFIYQYGSCAQEQEIIKKAVPTMAKPNFTENDFDRLTPKERLILDNVINKGETLSTYTRSDYRISKDTERILHLATGMKESLDQKYPNGYKLVSIGNSAAPFVETMQLLGADTVVIPFSRTLLRGGFPFVKKTNKWEKPVQYTKENWVDYFKHFGITSDFTENTGKQLIFTDYSASGFTTHLYIKPLLENLGLTKNTQTVDILQLLADAQKHKAPDKKLGFFDIPCIIDHASYKKFSVTESAKNINFDVFLNPELIKTVEQPFESKLFRYALWKQLKKIK